MAVGFIMMVMLFDGHANKQSRKHREHVRLDKRHQEFEKIDKQGEGDTHWSYTVTRSRTKNIGKGKDQTNQTQDHKVTGRHVGKKSNGQRDRFSQDPEDLNGHQDGLHKGWNPWRPKNMHPIILGAPKLRYDKRKGGQHYRNHEVRSGRSTKWNETKQVTRQDEKENGQ